ncbi:MAG TPA: universal stress protein [Bacteroidia bacterium]|nr:universal stress protein [Bacteroidia bacterium]
METIVVGTDFSAPANNAVDYAVNLAKFFNTKLVLVNAYPLPVAGYDTFLSSEIIASVQDSSIKGLEALRSDIIRKNYDFGIECVSEAGTSAAVVNWVASRCSADLVVMGMVGEGGFLKKHLLGSSALQAARDLTIPLFIVPEAVTYQRVQRICFACDMEKIEEGTLLQTARYFASVFGAEIEIVTVKQSREEVAWNKSETYAVVEKRLRNTKHKSVYIKDNDVSQALEYYFKFHKTDLVLVNPKKHGFFQTLFGESVTENLAFNIEVPLLIIH